MNRKLLTTGSILGLLAIVLGAFAAHGLEKLVDADAIKTFETGVRYQMYHAFLFLILGSTSFLTSQIKKMVFYLALVGVIFFSGSIYGLATNVLTSFDFKTIALVTPIGGLLLILGWIMMLIGILRKGDD